MLLMDIHSKKPYPSGSLSNFAAHSFQLDGVPINSMEGLLQSLKVAPERQADSACWMLKQQRKLALLFVGRIMAVFFIGKGNISHGLVRSIGNS